MGIITHESGHAALAWFRRKFPRCDDLNDMKYEEELCYALGYIGKEIEDEYKQLIAQGHWAADITGKRDEIIREFDPNADILMMPKVSGG